MLRPRTLFCILVLFLKHSVSQTTSCTQSCDCFNPKAGDVHKEDGAQSCCISSSGSGICKQTCADGDTCNLSKDRSKGGICFTKSDTECPTDTNCGKQMDGTTSRNVDGECVKCNSGSFAADNTVNCAANTICGSQLNGASRLSIAATAITDAICSACSTGSSATTDELNCAGSASPTDSTVTSKSPSPDSSPESLKVPVSCSVYETKYIYAFSPRTRKWGYASSEAVRLSEWPNDDVLQEVWPDDEWPGDVQIKFCCTKGCDYSIGKSLDCQKVINAVSKDGCFHGCYKTFSNYSKLRLLEKADCTDEEAKQGYENHLNTASTSNIGLTSFFVAIVIAARHVYT